MTPELAALIEKLRHACSVAFGDLLALEMPAGASTGKLLQEVILAAEKQLAENVTEATNVPFIHGEITAIQTLGASALDYTRQIMDAAHAGAPIGSPSVAHALCDLKHAAVGYALMMIFSENLLSVEEIQRIDDAITAGLNEEIEEIEE